MADPREGRLVIDDAGHEIYYLMFGDGEDVVLEADGHDLVDAGHRLGDEFEHLGWDTGLVEVDDRHAPLLGEGFGDLLLGDEAHADGDLADDLAGGLFLLFEHVPELVLIEVAEVDQDLSEASLGHCGVES